METFVIGTDGSLTQGGFFSTEMKLLIVASLLLFTCVNCGLLPIVDNANYTWYCTGNCNSLRLAVTPPQAGTLMIDEIQLISF